MSSTKRSRRPTTRFSCCTRVCTNRHAKGPAPIGAGPCSRFTRSGGCLCAHPAHVGSLQALGALADIELHLLVLLQVAEPRLLDGAEMYEYIRPAILGDEAVSLLGVEPLHHTSCHLQFPF